MGDQADRIGLALPSRPEIPASAEIYRLVTFMAQLVLHGAPPDEVALRVAESLLPPRLDATAGLEFHRAARVSALRLMGEER